MGHSAQEVLKLATPPADTSGVRISRLVIEADRNTVSLAFHPRLTVVAGVPAPVRTILADEMIGGLSSTRSGVHLELATDAGKQLTVFRPSNGQHRVVEPETGSDVSDDFRSETGRIDVFAHYGIDSSEAHELLHLDRAAVAVGPPRNPDVTRLSEINQAELWSAAARVQVTDDELKLLAREMEQNTEDAAVVARVEKHHQTFEAAIEQQRRIHQSLTRVAGFSILLALPVALVDVGQTLPLLAIGAITVVLAFLYNARVDAAKRSEASALAAAGSNSYLGFVVKRVDGMMNDTEHRRRLSAVAEDHRAAAIRWTRLAGNVSIEWAFAHQAEIDSAARLSHHLSALSQVSSTAPELDDETAALAQGVLAHLARLRRAGTGGESFPLILDDPFTDVDPATKLSILEVLARSAGRPQVVLLTDQDDVASWARFEALTGGMALVEPLAPAGQSARSADLAV